jgi:ribosomal protein L24E
MNDDRKILLPRPYSSVNSGGESQKRIATILRRPRAILEILDPTPEECTYAVFRDPSLIEFLDPDMRNVELSLYAVRKDGLLLRFVSNQTYDMKIAAVRQNPFALAFVRDPDLVIRREAMRGSKTLQSI